MLSMEYPISFIMRVFRARAVVSVPGKESLIYYYIDWPPPTDNPIQHNIIISRHEQKMTYNVSPGSHHSSLLALELVWPKLTGCPLPRLFHALPNIPHLL